MPENNPPLNVQNRFFVLIVVLDRMTNKVVVQGNLADKKFCINTLASGIHAVNSIKEEEGKIVKSTFVSPWDVGKKS